MEAPQRMAYSEVQESAAETNSRLQHLRVAATVGGMAAWRNTGWVLEIAAGKAAEHAGMNGWLAATAVMAVATAETYGMSHVAEKSAGDFSYEPKRAITKKLAHTPALPPLVSLWSGAPSGVLLDKAAKREVTPTRRLAHSLPYGAALGYLWVSPNPVGQFVTGTVEKVPEFGKQEIEHHPTASALILGAAAVAFVGQKIRVRRKQNAYDGRHRQEMPLSRHAKQI